MAGFKKSDLHAAHFPIHYDEGFPSTEMGVPLWEQFEFEPHDAYTSFQVYAQMSKVSGGVRSLHQLPDLMLTNGILALEEGQSAESVVPRLKLYFQIYSWQWRVKAYDLYKSAAYKKALEFRAIETLDDDYAWTNRLIKKTLEYVESDEDFWDMMTPKVAVDMLKMLTGARRLSAGLPAAAPPGERKEDAGRDFEMIFRTLAQQTNTQGNDVGDIKAGDGHITNMILQNPDTLKLAQELIIKVSGAKKSD